MLNAGFLWEKQKTNWVELCSNKKIRSFLFWLRLFFFVMTYIFIKSDRIMHSKIYSYPKYIPYSRFGFWDQTICVYSYTECCGPLRTIYLRRSCFHTNNISLEASAFIACLLWFQRRMRAKHAGVWESDGLSCQFIELVAMFSYSVYDTFIKYVNTPENSALAILYFAHSDRCKNNVSS